MGAYARESDKGLVNEISDAMGSIPIPSSTNDEDSYMPHKDEFRELVGLTQEEVLDMDVFPLLEDCPNGEEGHSIRVAIIGLAISKMLSFDQDERIEYFLTGTAHDLGKLKVTKYYPEKNPYRFESQDYLNFLEIFKHSHVDPKNIPFHWGTRVASAIEGTHFYQKGNCNNGPYPKKLVLPRTPESELLSKLIAIPDFIDAISSRPSKTTGVYRSPDEIIDLTMREYGDLKINYSGNIYTNVDVYGREIIQELQITNFICREKPANMLKEDFRMNPFIGLEIK